jgi:hypothetical protein
VLLEAYAVLTRLPSGLAVSASDATAVLGSRFDGQPLALPAHVRGALPGTLAAVGVFGGSSYDGLVALEAAHHTHRLLTLDRRAQITYRRLGVDFSAIDDPGTAAP